MRGKNKKHKTPQRESKPTVRLEDAVVRCGNVVPSNGSDDSLYYVVYYDPKTDLVRWTARGPHMGDYGDHFLENEVAGSVASRAAFLKKCLNPTSMILTDCYNRDQKEACIKRHFIKWNETRERVDHHIEDTDW